MNSKKVFGITVGVNLLVFLIYSIIIYSDGGNSGPYTPDLAGIFFLSIPHWIFCFLMATVFAFINNGKRLAQGFGVSGLLILILGFSSCFG
ncbi:hypothetical protein [Nonlabens xiamenensis]|uniref:hypothetical protein n=1 Tax=Nonlabens xiamenensis TaxID=2341043 RepID=UPI000F609F09|nr:hypothetical protein [Nonlabens xiamenensis]